MIISIGNQKGGVGKTTTTQAMASGLSLKGYKVLLIDLDSQGSLSMAYGADNEDSEELTVYEVLKGIKDINSVIQTKNNIDIIPASINLTGADMEFNLTGREYLLRDAIKMLDQKYDYILIDTPPALGILTINAFAASHKLVIPMEADSFSLKGLGQLNSTIKMVVKYCNPKLEIEGILLIKHKPRTILSKNFTKTIQTIARDLGTKVYKSYIRESVSIREAQATKTDILEYAQDSSAQTDYVKFINEFLVGVSNG